MDRRRSGARYVTIKGTPTNVDTEQSATKNGGWGHQRTTEGGTKADG